ncbi:MAG: ABC transporter substrate-binding protein [Chroococcales cyanobacterium]
MSWTCDGVPKDGKSYASSGPHPPYDNSSSFCDLCGLPKEALETNKPKKPKKTHVSRGSHSAWILPAMIAVIILILGGGGFALYQAIGNRNDSNGGEAATNGGTSTASSNGLVSDTAVNPQLISQGEKILFDPTPAKQAGATAFTQQNWDEAIAQYQQATTQDPNDPEAKLYLNNAKARKAGNPLAIAVVVPINPNNADTTSRDSAKEVLRGVALSQEEFNKAPLGGRLLEVVIVDEANPSQAAAIAQDIINAPNVLGVLGHGVDNNSQQAIRMYEANQLPLLSSLTTSVTPGTPGQSNLKVMPIDQKTNELLSSYLQSVGKTLAQYASQQHSPPRVAIFYNSNSLYSQKLKQDLINGLLPVNGQVIKEVDITAATFNPTAEMVNVQQSGANTAFFALSKNKVNEAVELAQANANLGGNALTLIGGDELYNPTILVNGRNAIEGLVLAVPWSFQGGNSFSQNAMQIWRGRVSWRTATAYDATQALLTAIRQNPTRAAASQQLSQGITISGTTTDFNVFNDVPLVKAVAGNAGPAGSNHQFDPLP